MIVGLTMFANVAMGQKIYSVKYESQAQVKVFVVKYESQADLLVYKVAYESQAGQNDGKWFFVDYESRADKKIFFVDYESRADLKIFFVDYESRAGWKNNAKKHLMYWMRFYSALNQNYTLECGDETPKPEEISSVAMEATGLKQLNSKGIGAVIVFLIPISG